MEEKDIDPKAIRTYEGDIADAIQHRQTSQASIMLASEEKKRQEEKGVVVMNADQAPKKKGTWIKNTLLIVGSLVLLGGGAYLAFYFYKISPLSVQQPSTPPPATQTAAVPSLITPDQQKVVDVTNQTPGEIISQISKEIQANPLPQGGILGIVLGQQASTTENGKTTTMLAQVTGPQFISLMGLTPPNAFVSSLANQWMLGIYSPASSSSGTSPVPFVILTNNFFQNAFAGMLSWEATMPADLSGLFGIQTTQWVGGSFHDKLVKNKDVREFTDSNGNVLFLYSFINENTLVITENEAALGEIIDRFESQAYVR